MIRKLYFQLLLALLVGGIFGNALAQGTAFFYQGQLSSNGSPASAPYDFRFAIYDAATNGNAISYPLTNFATVVSSGLFTATLDFGPIFSGTNYWLAIGVRTNGSTNAFTILWPRQALLPVPYAEFATSSSNLLGTLPAAQLTGMLPSAQVAGTYSGAVNFTNSTNSFSGSFSGSFFGNGTNLMSLNASQLTGGTVADARLSTNVALLNRSQTNGGANLFTGSNVFSGGNTFTGSNSFTGANFFSGANTFAASNSFTGSNIFSGVNTFSNAGNVFFGIFSGNGTNLTSLNASQLTGGTVADARLSTNVSLLNRSQTNGGSNLFTGANNFTNYANTFVGNFFGNGLVGWLTVGGTAVTAVRDTGYLLLSAGLTTVTLPATASLLAGDIVRISGGGAGGWLVQENSGQSTLGTFASYRNGVLTALPVTGLPSTSDCRDVAASADGTLMYAVGNFAGVYSSSDSGHNWNVVGSLAGSYYSVACSANGQIVYIASSAGGTIQMSTNGGLNWSSTTSSGTSVACSSDGSKLFTGTIACSGNGNYLAEISAGIAVSNSISGWFSIPSPFGTPSCLAVSSDCTRLVAGVSGGLLYASANQGATWTALTTTNQYWSGAWMSADGSRFAATVAKNVSPAGGIFSSSIISQPNTVSTKSICGSQGSAVELQYIGSGEFVPVSTAGSLWSN